MDDRFYCLSLLVIECQVQHERRGVGVVWGITLRAWMLHYSNEENT